MHIRKAVDQLKTLAGSPATLDTYTKAAALLDGLAQENQEVEIGESPNETVDDKIDSARGWFEILCGIGEDGGWTEAELRDFILRDLYLIADQIERESRPESPDFIRRES
jgi:hypothetical protein